jgi:hypothetical protein
MMKKHERDAAIAKLQAEIEALQNTPAEPDLHPMTLPLQRAAVDKDYYRITSEGEPQRIPERLDRIDNRLWATANYYADKEQAERYAEAFLVLRLMRRQPGIVDPSKVKHCSVNCGSEGIRLWSLPGNPVSYCSYMFPVYESEAAAQAAVDAVGKDRVISVAKWLAGVVE